MMIRSPISPFAGAADGHGAGGGASTPSGVPVDDVLDRQALEGLRELDPDGKNQLMSRVFQAFTSSIGRYMPQVATARQTGDLEMVRHVAHTLKSSSSSIGAIKLSKLCADIESMVRQSSTQGLPEKLDAMQAEVVRVVAALEALQEKGA